MVDDCGNLITETLYGKVEVKIGQIATKAQLAVDIDFEKATYPLMSMPKFDGCRAINLSFWMKLY